MSNLPWNPYPDNTRRKSGVSFGQYHSETDFGLILQPYSIPLPEVKTEYIDIPGADGSIDLSEILGDVCFSDRVFKLTLKKLDRARAWEDLITPVANATHGRRLHIVFDSDPDFYFIGRCRLLDLVPQRAVATVSIELRCEPYKYQEITRDVALPAQTNASATVFLPGSRKKVHPVVTNNVACRIKWGDAAGKSIEYSAGTHDLTSFTVPLETKPIEVINLAPQAASAVQPVVTIKYTRGIL